MFQKLFTLLRLLKDLRLLPDIHSMLASEQETQQEHLRVLRETSATLISDQRDLRQNLQMLQQAIAQVTGERYCVAQALHERMLQNLTDLKPVWPIRRQPSVMLSPDRTVEVPPLENRVRVQGIGAIEHPDDAAFVQSGFLDLRCVMNIAEVEGVDICGEIAVLDWGVGCARMARHLPANLRGAFVGADVDPVNIEWSRNHVPFGQFVTIDPYASTQFESKSFDLIYSHSVLTHLSEKDQDHWLQELSRLCRGLMILSVNGVVHVASIASWAKKADEFWMWVEHGFRDAGRPNPDIQDVTDSEYYRDVAHSPEYIRRHWSQFVEVIDIIPGGFGHIHDAVVCRAKN